MRLGRPFTYGVKLLPLILALFCLPALVGAAELIGGTEPQMKEDELVQILKQGGHVVYFRHGPTTKTGEKTVEKQDLGNCAVQRNLSAEGQEQTKAMGEGIKRLQIPIGEVYSSPYCRCVDTAMNLFGRHKTSDALHFAIHTSREDSKKSTDDLLKMLATQPPAGKNTMVVSHTANLKAAVNIFPRPEGVAHVFKPEGNGKFSYLGLIMPETWANSAPAGAVSEDGKGKGFFGSIKSWFSSLF